MLKSQRRFAPFAALAVVLIPALIPALTPAALRADEAAAFARRIREAVNPQFEGEQFGDGTITRIMEDRYVSTFEPQTFNQSMNNDNVGGIVLRPEAQQPLKVLHLKRATFTIDDTADVSSVIFRLAADSNQVELRVHATIVPAAALMATDRRLVLLTLAAGSGRQSGPRSHAQLAAAHPAIARHQLAYMATRLDLSLSNVMGEHGHYYILCEKPWRLGLNSFAKSDDLFTVRCRIGSADTTPPGITQAWRKRLRDEERVWLGELNDFVTVRRLVRGVLNRSVVGFPEDDFIALLKRLQPTYEKHKLTPQQVNELSALLTNF